jgi:hypothetical protein
MRSRWCAARPESSSDGPPGYWRHREPPRHNPVRGRPTAIERVNAITAPFDAQYAAKFGTPTSPATEPWLMIGLPRRSRPCHEPRAGASPSRRGRCPSRSRRRRGPSCPPRPPPPTHGCRCPRCCRARRSARTRQPLSPTATATCPAAILLRGQRGGVRCRLRAAAVSAAAFARRSSTATAEPALRGEPQRRGPSDTRARPRDQRDLALEPAAYSTVHPPSTTSAWPVM